MWDFRNSPPFFYSFELIQPDGDSGFFRIYFIPVQIQAKDMFSSATNQLDKSLKLKVKLTNFLVVKIIISTHSLYAFIALGKDSD